MERIYDFFSKRLWLLGLLLVGISAVAGYVLSGLRLTDDLSKMVPLDQQMERSQAAYKQTKISETLVFQVFNTDSQAQPDVDALLETSDRWVEQVRRHFVPDDIRELRYELADSLFFTLYDALYQRLPWFLDSADYARIEQGLAADSIHTALQNVYKNLLTPTSFVWKRNALRDPLAWTLMPLSRLRNLQISDRFVTEQGKLVGEDRRRVLCIATPSRSASDIDGNRPFYKRLDSLLAAFDPPPGIAVEYFAPAAVAVANADQIKSDVLWTVNGALLVLLIFIGLFFRRWWSFAVLLLPVALGAAVGLAALCLWSGSIAGISLGFGCILIGITIDYALHYLNHARATGSARRALRDVTLPLVMSALTTAAAFWCLRRLASEALRDLGLFVGISVLAAAFFTLLVLPHVPISGGEQSASRLALWVERRLSLPWHRNRYVMGAALVFSLLCLFFWRGVGFEQDLMRINYMPPALRQAEARLDSLTRQGNAIQLLVMGNDLEQALEHQEDLLLRLDSLRSAGLLQDYKVPTDLLRSERAQQKALERWQAFWTEERKMSLRAELQSQGVEFKFKPQAFDPLFEQLLAALPSKEAPRQSYEAWGALILSDYVHLTDTSAALLLTLFVENDRRQALYQALSREEYAVPLDRRALTGELVRLLNTDFNRLAFWSFLVVFVLLLVFFGRVELAVLTFLPVLLAWLWTLGIMGMLGWNMNIIDILISAFISGLGVDYSIFLARAMLHKYKYGEDLLPSYKTSIFLSALTTLLAIGALILARHPALHSVAFITIIGVSSVYIIPNLLIPFLFERFIVRRGERGWAPYTLGSWLATLAAYSYFLLGCLLLGLVIVLFKLLVFIPTKIKKNAFHKILQLFSKSLIYIMFNVKKVWIDVQTRSLDKPCVLIANHQSFLDIMLMVSLHPRLVLMTNDWVWNSPFFGAVVRYADFYPVSSGAEQSVDSLRQLYDRGYSIVIFPEGTRTPDGKLKRFKKGAFFLAEQLGADIQPVVLHGTGVCIRKHDLLVNSTTVSIQFLPRISVRDTSWGNEYQTRCKNITQYFKEAYTALRLRVETPRFFAKKLINNYIYKSPVLEWYVRIKLRLDGYYELFHRLIPSRAVITDIGCGYGMMSYMLHFLSEERRILGLDYDADKIRTARHCFSRCDSLRFEVADAGSFDYAPCDVFLISDMLHYIPYAEQQALLRTCIAKLNPGGKLIVRDGDRDLSERHKGTEWSERFSTGLGFNQMKAGRMFYLSGKDLEALAREFDMDLERIDKTRKTSNVVFVLTKKANEPIARAQVT